MVSIHAPRTGRDVPSRRGRFDVLVSIHAPRTGRDVLGHRDDDVVVQVSIHAPRTGRDSCHRRPSRTLQGFNPRAPYGARLVSTRPPTESCTFQSTRPVRGATAAWDASTTCSTSFNPRAPYGARPRHRRGPRRRDPVSIHAPRTGRDRCPAPWICPSYAFQSTRPVRGATGTVSSPSLSGLRFQSTRPVRGATEDCMLAEAEQYVSIHAPRTGRDRTPPRQHLTISVSIHAPRTGRDSQLQEIVSAYAKFQSTRPVRGATTGPRRRR